MERDQAQRVEEHKATKATLGGVPGGRYVVHDGPVAPTLSILDTFDQKIEALGAGLERLEQLLAPVTDRRPRDVGNAVAEPTASSLLRERLDHLEYAIQRLYRIMDEVDL